MLISKTYQFEFEHPVDKLWAVVSDTPRWGEASGFPKYQASEQLLPDGTVKVVGKVTIAGITITWEEPPVNWIAERWFEQQRLFTRGPMRSMTTSARLEDKGAGSSLEIELSFESRNLVGTMLAKRLVNLYQDKVRELLKQAAHLINAEQPDLFVSSYQPSQSALQRAKKITDTLTESPYEHGLANKLVDHINKHQEVDLWSMRPIAIAGRWKIAPRKVIELFLQSVRGGLLESRWDILCPRCRVSKSQVTNMSQLPRGVHCEACNIDFQSDFARNVELSFSPSPSIRQVEYGFYCRSGPGVTPHIKGQCSLPPGTNRSLPLILQPGDYRIRTLEAGEQLELTWEQGPFPEICVDDNAVQISGDSGGNEISIRNRGRLPRTIVIEEQSWLRDVLTAEHVTTMQAFRDLFSDQLLRPGDDIRIRNISFMFTDLVGSSALFARLGDAEAYHLVREHFAMLADIVRHHQGNIVKTVGDGIHAAFLLPDDALRASIEAQQAMPGFIQDLGLDGVAIRIGLHTGSSIAVTLNERLDYYGEAVNLAARLEGRGAAGDITMSKNFACDPAVSDILSSHDIREQEIDVKGFADAIAIAQITPLATDDKIF